MSRLVRAGAVAATRRRNNPLALSISQDNRFLLDEAGNPLLLNGDTPWSLIVELTQAETTTYLNDRQAKGFNTLLINTIDIFFGTNAPANANNDPPFVNNDYAQPVEDYWAHVDWVIQEATNRGFYLQLTPSYVGFDGGQEGWYSVMVSNGASKMFDYGEWLGNRYNAYKNIIWVNGGDYNPPNRDVVHQLALGLKSTMPDALHMVHCAPETHGTDYWNPSTYTWLDIETLYTRTGIYTASQTRYNAGERPFIQFEARYENESSVGAQQVRAQAYHPILFGGTGHNFGNCPIWSFETAQNFCTNMGWTWQQSMDFQGSVDMQHLGALFGSRDWYKLLPDYSRTFVTAGYSTSGWQVDFGAVAHDDSFGIVYFSSQKQLTIDMTEIGGTTIQAWWFNPRTGAVIDIGTFPTTGTQNFTPPSSGDFILVLDNDALGLGQPG